MNIRSNRSKIVGFIVDSGILWINLLTHTQYLELYDEVEKDD